jgi:ACS family sodium-dependent inorganic phosphate cotransporter
MAGFQSGSVVGLLAAPAMLAWGGVQRPFLVFGVLGVAWAATWAFTATTFPRQSKRVNEQELVLIENGSAVVQVTETPSGKSDKEGVETKTKTKTKTEERVPLKTLLRAPPVLACIFANFVNNWGYFILLAWMPLYFKQHLGLELAKSAQFSALPWFAMAITGVFAGVFADWLINVKRVSRTTTRKITQGIGFVGPALGLLVLTFTTTPTGALAALTFAVACTAFTQAGFLVNFAVRVGACPNLQRCLLPRLFERTTRAVCSIANTAVTLTGVLAPLTNTSQTHCCSYSTPTLADSKD